MPIGLGNAIRWLKYEISNVDIDEAEADVRAPFRPAGRRARVRED